MPVHVSIEQEELRGISPPWRDPWLLLILILLYLIFGGVAKESAGDLVFAVLLRGAGDGVRYANFFRTESRWKIASRPGR